MGIKLGLLRARQVLDTPLHHPPHPEEIVGERERNLVKSSLLVHLARKVILLMLDFPKPEHNNKSPSTLWCI